MVIVPPYGSKDAKVALVGEAPGRKEVEMMQPFVGASGNLLMGIMSQVGLSRSQCYITNVVKERPPNNNISKFIKMSGSKVTETPEFLEYVEELREELSETKANIIVAVGAISLWALCRKTGITKWRGSILESTLLPGRKVIPIIHPSAALRQYIFRYYILNDMYKVIREKEYKELKLPQRDLRILTSLDLILNWIDSMNDVEEVGFDIETINDEMSCFSLAKSPTSCCTIPIFSPTKGNLFNTEDELLIIKELGKLLQNEKVTKVGQNIIFDAGFMFRKYGIVTRNVDDTMIAHSILYPDFPKGLDFLTSMYTNEPYYKDEGKMWKKINTDDEMFWIYNAKDSAVTLEVWLKLKAELKANGNMSTYIRQKSLIEPLIFLTEHGIRMDVDGLKAESKRIGLAIDELKGKITKEVGHEINPNSVNDLKNYFYIEKGYKAYVNRKTGNITVDRNALKRLSAKGDRVAQYILDLRAMTKLKSTYLDVKLSKDGRLRASFNPVGTESGRLSSSKTFTGEGTNLQNQPKEMKRYMLADDGCLIYEIDLSQAENRIVAYVAPEPKMIKAFEDGTDVHSLTASLIFGDPIEKIIEENEKGIPAPIGDMTHTKRFWGKKANHGLNYGLGYRTFAFYYEIPETDAKRIVEAYHKAYPGVRNYHRWIREALSKSRTIQNLKGRKKLFLDRWGDQLFKQAYSFIPQSTVADVINETLHHIYCTLDDVILLNQVHDSIVFEIPIHIGIKRHIELIKQIVEWLESPLEAWGVEFSIPAEVKVGKCLGELIDLDINNGEEILEELANEKTERLA